jgi:formylmethanofuran dehydrogenase subunit A
MSSSREDKVEIKTLKDAKQWHRNRLEFFSHGGMPWGAMAQESKAILDVLEAAEDLLLDMHANLSRME